jgi:hypothetical protein
MSPERYIGTSNSTKSVAIGSSSGRSSVDSSSSSQILADNAGGFGDASGFKSTAPISGNFANVNDNSGFGGSLGSAVGSNGGAMSSGSSSSSSVVNNNDNEGDGNNNNNDSGVPSDVNDNSSNPASGSAAGGPVGGANVAPGFDAASRDRFEKFNKKILEAGFRTEKQKSQVRKKLVQAAKGGNCHYIKSDDEEEVKKQKREEWEKLKVIAPEFNVSSKWKFGTAFTVCENCFGVIIEP